MQLSVPEKAPYYIIYQTINLVNGKVYIGAHKTNNFNDDYLGSGTILFKAIEKYGRSKFKRNIICFCSSKEEMYQVEREFITSEFISINRDILYNTKSGGIGGYNSRKGKHHSDETKRKLREITRGPISAETRKKISIATKGIRKSEAWIKALQQSTKGRKFSECAIQKAIEYHKNNPPWNKGMIGVSLETREKMRVAKLGKSLSIEQRQNMRKSQILRRNNERNINTVG